MKLSNEQRILMREKFSIPKSGGVVMQNNIMLTDGSNENDLKAINITSMQEFLGEQIGDVTFELLYNLTLKKIDGIIEQKEKNRLLEIEQEKNMQRLETVDQMVLSMIETFKNLPPDAQDRLRTIAMQTQKEIGLKHMEDITNYLNKKENVKENNSTKETEQSTDQQTVKGTGKGSRKTKKIS